MKIIRYSLLSRINTGTPDTPVWEEVAGTLKGLEYSEANLEIAKAEAYNGEIEIVDDGEPEQEETPTQLDVIEAQVTYTAMMTDTLLEV